MNDKSKTVDPIPEEFASYEEAANFWDTHDTTDYLDGFETVPVATELHQRKFEVEIEEDLIQVLSLQARQRGLNLSQIVNILLRKTLKDVV